MKRGDLYKVFDIFGVYRAASGHQSFESLPKFTEKGSELLIEGKSATRSLSIFDIGWSQSHRLEWLPEGCQFNSVDIRFKIVTRKGDSEVNYKYDKSERKTRERERDLSSV